MEAKTKLTRGYFVYRYVHPDYPWLYVGKTKNLLMRSHQHSGKGDNIPQEYKNLVAESTLYFIKKIGKKTPTSKLFAKVVR